jgi:hypothetical protein
MSDSLSIRKRRVLVANGYSASGHGRGNNAKNVYLIDGYYYAYHPEYAKQAFHPLDGEFVGYVPVNSMTMGERVYYYQCDPQDCPILSPHIPAKVTQ